MTAEANAVRDRLGETTDHATIQSPVPGPKVDGPPNPTGEGRGGPYLYTSGARPLAGYTIKRGVGTGGFGEVYYAVSDAGKDVALKLIRRNLETELRGMKQCLNLKHPNLLSLFDIRVDDSGDTWIVMEYIAGKSLEAVLAEHPNGLPPDEALNWFRGIALGVAYLHDHGIVHRDLKPGNIFSDEGVVKVGDYGLSKFISCSRRSGHTESIGTVHYMAPEVAHGRYGKELDIYALGAVLFELLTGRVPFDGESVGEVLMKHLTAQPDVSRLPEPYRGVVARALDKDPTKRFASVNEMLAALRGGASREPFAGFTSSAQPAAAAGGIPHGIPIAKPVPMLTPAEILDDADQEPIARAVRQAIAQMRQAWRTADLPQWLRVLIIVGIVLTLLSTTGVWLPLGFFLLVVYGGYRAVRWFYRSVIAPPPTRPAYRPTMAMPQQPAAPRVPSPPPAPVFVVKPPLERFRELIGSLLVSAAVTAAVCVVSVLIAAHGNHLEVQPGQCAWLFLVSLTGSWTVLIAGKFWEGREGEPMLRRFLLMTLGLGLGLAACAAADAFHAKLPADEALLRHTPLPSGLKFADDFYREGQPLVMAHMAAFAALLALVRWWRQSDPLRSARLSLASLVVSVIAAHIVASVLQFPEPWLMMVAGCMSVAVQLASPWVPTHARLRPQRKKVI
jgi:hypothetical protein